MYYKNYVSRRKRFTNAAWIFFRIKNETGVTINTKRNILDAILD